MSTNQAKPKVLVADDERVIADTLAIILNQSGFDATAVYSGEKAVEMAIALKPDMVISDVIMTDMNGIDAAIRIRAILPSCKILLFPGKRLLRICSTGRASGVTSSKFSPNLFIRRIYWRVFAADRKRRAGDGRLGLIRPRAGLPSPATL